MSLDIKFEYEFKGYGWSKAYLKIGDAEVVFPRISWSCLPITDLLQGLLGILEEWAIIANYGKDVEITNDESVFTWEDEPGGYEWELERYNENQIRVIIRSLYHNENNEENFKEIILDKTVDFKIFLMVILKPIDTLVKEYGLLGCGANWGADTETHLQFPLSHFLELKHYLLYGKILCIRKKGTTSNWSLKEELELLNAEIT